MTKWDLPIEAFQGMSDFDAYQYHASKTAIYPEEVALEYTALGLTSESGEFSEKLLKDLALGLSGSTGKYAGKIKKKIRDGVFSKHEAMAELGDVLWYIAMASEALGYKLSEVANYNTQKLKDRKECNALSGNGDFR